MYKRKKLLYVIFSFFLIIILYLTIDINIKNICKDIPRLIKSINDLGISQLSECKNPIGLKTYLRKKSKYLFEMGAFIKRKYISKNKRNKITFSNLSEEEYKILQKKNYPEFYENDLYIEGVINTNFDPKSIGLTYKESNNSYRQNKDNINSKFYTNKRITKENIGNLKLAWKYKDIPNKKMKRKWKYNIETSPLFAEGMIFYVGANHKLFAMSAEDGEIIWSKQILHNPARRGFLWNYDELKKEGYIYLPVEQKMFKIKSADGSLEKSFGSNGYIKLGSTRFSPIIFEENIYYVDYHGSAYSINKKTGATNFKIGIYPKKNFQGGVPWGGIAFDEYKKILYLVTGNPRPGTFGVKRKGNNKNSNSIIAIDTIKKKIIWTFQETSHDLWDLDLAFPPILITLNINNKNYDCILVGSKVGNIILLERYTGKPIFDFEYRVAPPSKVPNEITSPYQPFFTKPTPVTTFDFKKSNLDKLPKDQSNFLKKKLKKYELGWYQPPSLNIPLLIQTGGPHWVGGSINPLKKKYYTTVNNIPTVIKMYLLSEWPHTKIEKKFKDYHNIYTTKCASCHGKNREGYKNRQGGTQTSFKENVPSLVGYYLLDYLEKKIKNYENFNLNHKKLNLTKEEFMNINKLFKHWDEKLKKNNSLIVGYNYDYFENQKNGLPATNPPYGEIVSYDLPSGEIQWRVPFGKVQIDGKELNLGTFNNGGLASTINGIIFATGTFDNKIIALDAENGNEIWSYQMAAAGSAPPIIFSHNGKDYVSVISTGSNEPLQSDAGGKKVATSKDSTIYTFRLEN